MQQGWIKLHRKLLENPICKKPNYVWLWILLLLKANHDDTSFIWNGQKHICKKGQIMTGRLELARESGIRPGTVENILKYLENEQQIEQQTTTKFRLITINKYSQYQNLGQQIEQRSDNKMTTNEQQNDTNNNDKNYKNEKNKYKGFIFFELKEFADIWVDYLKMRKEKKKPATERAQKSVLQKLHNTGNPDIAIKMLENSIVNSWTDVYPLKETQTTVKKKPYYNGNPMSNQNGKWKVIVDGQWLEFNDTEDKIIWQ